MSDMTTYEATTAMDSVTMKAYSIVVSTGSIQMLLSIRARNVYNAIDKAESQLAGSRVITLKEIRPKFLPS